MENTLSALGLLGQGMAAIFIVAFAIWGIVKILNSKQLERFELWVKTNIKNLFHKN